MKLLKRSVLYTTVLDDHGRVVHITVVVYGPKRVGRAVYLAAFRAAKAALSKARR